MGGAQRWRITSRRPGALPPSANSLLRRLSSRSTLHAVLPVRIVKPKLVTGSFAVNLAIRGVLDRAVRISPNGRTAVVRTIDIPASALSGDPEGALLVARLDPADRVTEYRERNDTLRARVR